MTGSSDIDRAIAAYRAELSAEAAIGSTDLDEIEDHLRSLIDELRATGATTEAAIATARVRLGDPRKLAREHARVRTPFGAKLSRARQWSAFALIAYVLVDFALHTSTWRPTLWLDTALCAAVLAALATGATWGRAIALGMALPALVWTTIVLITAPAAHVDPLHVAAYLGATAFLVPWRRGEVTLAGLSLALLAPTFKTVLLLAGSQLTNYPHAILAYPAFSFVLLAVIAAGVGGVRRARWGAIASGVAAVSFGGMLVSSGGFTGWPWMFLAQNSSAVVCAALSSVLAWQSTRPLFGAGRDVLA